MYKAIFTADWHLSNKLPYSKTMAGMDGISDRLLEQMGIIRQIIKAAKELEVDGFYILGDIFDKRSLDAIVLKAGAQLISELLEVVSNVFITVGNHDVYSLTSSRSVNEFFDFIGNGGAKYLEPETIVDTAEMMNKRKGEVRFHVLPWCSLDVAGERLKSMVTVKNSIVASDKITKSKGLNVLLLHHSVKGAVDRNWVSEDGLNPEDLDRDWDLILSGHFHDKQSFGDKGHYVSAPMQHDFGDEGKGLRGYYLGVFDVCEYKLEFKTTDHHCFHSMMYSTYLLNPNENLVEWKDGDYVRFDVLCTHAEWKMLKTEVEETEGELIKKGFRVIPARFIPQTQHGDRIELSEDASSMEIVSRYLDVTSHDGLDRSKLIEIANHALKEVEND